MVLGEEPDINFEKEYGEPMTYRSINKRGLESEEEKKLESYMKQLFNTTYVLTLEDKIICNSLEFREQNYYCLCAVIRILSISSSTYENIEESNIDENLIEEYAIKIYEYLNTTLNNKKHVREDVIKKLEYTIFSMIFMCKKIVKTFKSNKLKLDYVKNLDYTEFLERCEEYELEFKVDDILEKVKVKETKNEMILNNYIIEIKNIRISGQNAKVYRFKNFSNKNYFTMNDFVENMTSESFIKTIYTLISTSFSNCNLEIEPFNKTQLNKIFEFILIEQKSFYTQTPNFDYYSNFTNKADVYYKKIGNTYFIAPGLTKKNNIQSYSNLVAFSVSQDLTLKINTFNILKNLVTTLLKKTNLSICINTSYERDWLIIRLDTNTDNYSYEKYILE